MPRKNSEWIDSNQLKLNVLVTRMTKHFKVCLKNSRKARVSLTYSNKELYWGFLFEVSLESGCLLFVLGSSGCCRWFWVAGDAFGWLWVVVGGFGWFWLILAGFGWLWLVTAYLSGYTGQICLRLNLYFQHIKKLLQSKKVTYI